MDFVRLILDILTVVQSVSLQHDKIKHVIVYKSVTATDLGNDQPAENSVKVQRDRTTTMFYLSAFIFGEISWVGRLTN